MNDTAITMTPILCAPEKLDQKVLIEQVNYLQDAILQQGRTLHDVCCKLQEMNKLANVLSSHLYELVDAFEAGNQAQISDHLHMLSEQCRQHKAQKAKVH